MSDPLKITDVDEVGLASLAGLVAFAVRPGDTLALHGDLGAGKTTLARAVIRALLADPEAEVPSPTFSLVQSYATPRMVVVHSDLYRLADATDIAELGLDEAMSDGVVLVEWPDRARGQLSAERLDIVLSEGRQSDLRNVALSGAGDWPPRLARLEVAWSLMARSGWIGARVHYLQGDASPRRYARLIRPASLPFPHSCAFRTALLMDAPRQPDGPPIRNGLAYSRIAHLAEDVRPFVAVANALRQAGLSTPTILAHEMDHGMLLIEDLGDCVLGSEVASGKPQAPLWTSATDTLLALRRVPVPEFLPLPDGGEYRLAAFDPQALSIEIDLLLDWYWPALLGGPAPAAARVAFHAAWAPLFDRLQTLPKSWVLRDYHSPNLIHMPDRLPPADIGIIDFQDAMLGHAAYDLVSLLQDARIDVPAGLGAELLEHYCRTASAAEADFSEGDLRFAYAVLGAQRNTKILGIFARLARRDGKPQYLQHIPRIWGYIESNLASPHLSELRDWYDRYLPVEMRGRELTVRRL
jgi:tRNA threonylcarbamoyl adenosine modification protein YjeE